MNGTPPDLTKTVPTLPYYEVGRGVHRAGVSDHGFLDYYPAGERSDQDVSAARGLAGSGAEESAEAHVDLLAKYTDADIHDLAAYLVSLK